MSDDLRRTLRGFVHATELYALCADLDPSGRSVNRRTHAPEIRIEPPFLLVIGVTDVVADHRPLPANITSGCHFQCLREISY